MPTPLKDAENGAQPTGIIAFRVCYLLWMAFAAFAVTLPCVGVEMTVLSAVTGNHADIAFNWFAAAGVITVPLAIYLRLGGEKYLCFARIEREFNDVGRYASESGENSHAAQIEAFSDLVDNATGWERQEARAAAKKWLEVNQSAFSDEDMELAIAKFGYLMRREADLAA